jgi:hypothetical protein
VWCLTFEVRGRSRDGAWPAKRMMTASASRAKCHAGGGPLDRGVRPHCVLRLGACVGAELNQMMHQCWSCVHSRARRSRSSRAKRPSDRFEQHDREQGLVSRPPADGRPAPAQPDEKTRTASDDSTFALLAWRGDDSLLGSDANHGSLVHGVFAFEANHSKHCVPQDRVPCAA